MKTFTKTVDECDADPHNSAPVDAPVAQLDRVPGYEPGGREFESLRAHHQQGIDFAVGISNENSM
jgi:hypothetical protein